MFYIGVYNIIIIINKYLFSFYYYLKKERVLLHNIYNDRRKLRCSVVPYCAYPRLPAILYDGLSIKNLILFPYYKYNIKIRLEI